MANSFYKKLSFSLSFTLPLLVVSGVLFSLGFLFDPPFGTFLIDVGVYAYYLSYATLAAGIAYSIGDRIAIVPALIGGFYLHQGSTGLLGAVMIGVFVGYFTKALIGLFDKIPKLLSGIFPIFIYPVIITLITLGLSFLMNEYVSMVFVSVINFLFYDYQWLIMILSIGLAAMMAFDLGGPINKIAYIIAIMSMGTGLPSTVMVAVIAGGMVPPLVVSIIRLFHKEEGQMSWWMTGILGLSFMTEGAMSFVQSNRKTITPLMMIGSGIAGGVVGWFGLTTRIPHGGILISVFMTKWYDFFLALVIGMIVTLILLAIFRSKIKSKKTEETPLQV